MQDYVKKQKDRYSVGEHRKTPIVEDIKELQLENEKLRKQLDIYNQKEEKERKKKLTCKINNKKNKEEEKKYLEAFLVFHRTFTDLCSLVNIPIYLFGGIFRRIIGRKSLKGADLDYLVSCGEGFPAKLEQIFHFLKKEGKIVSLKDVTIDIDYDRFNLANRRHWKLEVRIKDIDFQVDVLEYTEDNELDFYCNGFLLDEYTGTINFRFPKSLKQEERPLLLGILGDIYQGKTENAMSEIAFAPSGGFFQVQDRINSFHWLMREDKLLGEGWLIKGGSERQRMEEGEKCPINLEWQSRAAVLVCGHKFSPEAIYLYAKGYGKNNACCPICRANIQLSEKKE